MQAAKAKGVKHMCYLVKHNATLSELFLSFGQEIHTFL